MAKTETQENQPPPGYPTENPPPTGKKKKWFAGTKKKWFAGTKKRGEMCVVEGCLAALCCCWICEECC